EPSLALLVQDLKAYYPLEWASAATRVRTPKRFLAGVLPQSEEVFRLVRACLAAPAPAPQFPPAAPAIPAAASRNKPQRPRPPVARRIQTHPQTTLFCRCLR